MFLQLLHLKYFYSQVYAIDEVFVKDCKTMIVITQTFQNLINLKYIYFSFFRIVLLQLEKLSKIEAPV